MPAIRTKDSPDALELEDLTSCHPSNKASRRSQRRSNLSHPYRPITPRLKTRSASVTSSTSGTNPSESSSVTSSPALTEVQTPITIRGVKLIPTVAFDTFWRFAAERKAIDDRRRAGQPPPWTEDKTLKKYFFCNTFRVLDKTCQFLIREVIEKGSQNPEEVVFRVVLFNLFTKIETWQLLESDLGPLTWATYNHQQYVDVLSEAIDSGLPLYTHAFIKPAPHFGHKRNFENHLCLLEVLMENQLYSRLATAPHMANVYEYLYSFPSMGPFSAYQLMLNLSYTNVLNFHRNDFVVSGPGSISGMRKLFGRSWKASLSNDLVFHQEVMQYLVNMQDYHFQRLGLNFSGLGPKKLPMDIADIEHTLCEVDKYCRVAHPALKGVRQNLSRLYHLPSVKSKPVYLPKAWCHPSRSVPRIRPSQQLCHEKRYEIKSIKAHRDQDGVRQYLVYWVGYPDSDASWEFESSLLQDAPTVVRHYLKDLTQN